MNMSQGHSQTNTHQIEVFVFGIDPGETTGFVLVSGTTIHDMIVREARSIPWNARFSIPQGLRSTPAAQTYIAIEEFVLYAGKAQSQIGQTFPSSQIIGAVEYEAYQLGLLDRVYRQLAALRRRVQILHALPAISHVRDAYQHARLRYLKTIINGG